MPRLGNFLFFDRNSCRHRLSLLQRWFDDDAHCATWWIFTLPTTHAVGYSQASRIPRSPMAGLPAAHRHVASAFLAHAALVGAFMPTRRSLLKRRWCRPSRSSYQSGQPPCLPEQLPAAKTLILIHIQAPRRYRDDRHSKTPSASPT